MSCCDALHREKLDKFAYDACLTCITSACLTAAGMCIPQTSNRTSSWVITGWNVEMEPVRPTSIFGIICGFSVVV